LGNYQITKLRVKAPSRFFMIQGSAMGELRPGGRLQESSDRRDRKTRSDALNPASRTHRRSLESHGAGRKDQPAPDEAEAASGWISDGFTRVTSLSCRVQEENSCFRLIHSMVAD